MTHDELWTKADQEAHRVAVAVLSDELNTPVPAEDVEVVYLDFEDTDYFYVAKHTPTGRETEITISLMGYWNKA